MLGYRQEKLTKENYKTSALDGNKWNKRMNIKFRPIEKCPAPKNWNEMNVLWGNNP